MEMFKFIGLGVAGVVLLYFGAEFLIRGGVAVARRLKVSPLLIGLTLVAFGTSAPELVVSIQAALNDSGDIAVGNVIGSNICNIALILGLCAVLRPVATNEKLFKLDMPLMVGSALLFSVFYRLDGRGINFWQGAVLFTILVAYLVWSVYQDKKSGSGELAAAAEEEAGEKPVAIPFALLMFIGGLAGLILGAKSFVSSAIFFAKAMGVSQAVIGLTIVAIGTSLPELATSVVAIIKGERDIAVGNVVGSNIFNILVIMGVAPMVSDLHAPNVSMIDLGVMIFCSVVLFPLMYTGKRISRGEGAFLLLVYVAYTVWLFVQGGAVNA
ncbi:MAG: calcium/sodium antiporter [Lentisphaeria bacterium]|nr:calcium/sodium antiporter [Lentisphaeria bacterium]